MHQPFVQIALPIMITLIIAVVVQNKRLDGVRADLVGRIDGLRDTLRSEMRTMRAEIVLEIEKQANRRVAQRYVGERNA